MSLLRQLQSRHVRYVALLSDWCEANDRALTWGETYRTPEQMLLNVAHGSGIAHSLHGVRLAVDLNLFEESTGNELTGLEDYRPLGDYWKSLDPLCCWGGDFTHTDADHFSLTWQGVK